MAMLWLTSIAIPATGLAQSSYSWELSGLALDGGSSDFELTSVGGTFYFDRIEEDDEPYALAAFFDPATLVSATLDRPLGTTADIWTVGGRHLLPDSLWYIGGRYRRNSTGYDSNILSFEEDAYRIVAGKYLGPRTTLELALDRSRGESTGVVAVCLTFPCPTGTSVVENDIASLSFVHVRQLGALTYAFNGGFEQVDSRTTFRDASGVLGIDFLQPDDQSVRTYSVGATLYPTKALGVHVGYEDDDGVFSEGTFSLGARWFFRRNVAVELGLSQRKFDIPEPFDDKFEQRSLRIVGRF